MTESAKNFERTECKSGESGNATASLGAELLTCKDAQDVFRQRNSSSASKDFDFLPSGDGLLNQLSAPLHGPRCEAPHTEQRGPVQVTVDEYGEMFAVKSGHDTFTKNSDGKWTRHFESGDYKNDEIVDNVKVDANGKLTYDYNDDARNVHVKFERNTDGSWKATNEFGTFVYDNQTQLVEAPSGEGRSRKFHYTNGQLDQIDGNLGHWDRVEKDGEVSWVNRDSGAVWEGDFKMNVDNLEYTGRNGSHWTFTPWGTDVNLAEQKQ
jgi:hypothetical protein